MRASMALQMFESSYVIVYVGTFAHVRLLNPAVSKGLVTTIESHLCVCADAVVCVL